MSDKYLNYKPFRIGSKDRTIFIILFVCLAIIPLIPEYTWISTMLILPSLTIQLVFSNKNIKIYLDKFIKIYLIIFVFAIISIINSHILSVYFAEIKQLLGVITIFIIAIYLLRRNINNIWLLYLILFSKFVIMLFYTYKSGIMIDIEIETSRLQSGAIIGINANAYGYFSFIALYILGVVMNISKKRILTVIFLIVLFVSIYINILAASRAGMLFSILSAIAVFLSLTFKSFKNLSIKLSIFLLFLYIILSTKIQIFENYHIFQRFNTFTQTGDDVRLNILQYGINLFINNPIGVGAGHFPIYMEKTSLGKIAASHNSFLLVGVNYGWFALFVFFYLFLYYFKNSLKLINNNNPIIKKYGVLFFSYGVLFLSYNIFYDMVLNLYIMLMFFLMNYHQNFIHKGIIPTIKDNEYPVY